MVSAQTGRTYDRKPPTRSKRREKNACQSGPSTYGTEGDPPAHDADAVDRVDERFHVRPQYVTGSELDHRHPSLIVPLLFYFDRRPMRRVGKSLHGTGSDFLRIDAYSTDQFPRKPIKNKEFRHLVIPAGHPV
jgi:hypothetical protein